MVQFSWSEVNTTRKAIAKVLHISVKQQAMLILAQERLINVFTKQ